MKGTEHILEVRTVRSGLVGAHGRIMTLHTVELRPPLDNPAQVNGTGRSTEATVSLLTDGPDVPGEWKVGSLFDVVITPISPPTPDPLAGERAFVGSVIANLGR